MKSINLLQLATDLLTKPSVTPADAGCQEYIADFLQQLGFSIQFMHQHDTKNLWAVYGSEAPLLVFAGHTDVVPPGPLHLWQHDPWSATLADGYLFGRGACDMKGAIAAMLYACYNVLQAKPKIPGSIAFLLTSDEEGSGRYGTQYVIAELVKQKVKFDHCLIGEPTSKNKYVDTIKNGRRGSLSAQLIVHGIQGHVAYPQLANNPIHSSVAILNALLNYAFTKTDPAFPATSLQLTNIKAGDGVLNVTPDHLELFFNIRYGMQYTHTELIHGIKEQLDQLNVPYDITWASRGEPFFTTIDDDFAQIARQAVHDIVGYSPSFSTDGGTSDGRFIAPIMGCPVLELGLNHNTIHQINEKVAVEELATLSAVYEQLLRKWWLL